MIQAPGQGCEGTKFSGEPDLIHQEISNPGTGQAPESARNVSGRGRRKNGEGSETLHPARNRRSGS